MKKIILFLFAFSVLLMQNTFAATVDQRPQTIKPAYEKITVPDQDLNNTNKPILYRYKITAPKSGPLTISGETIEIQAIGVVPETINLVVFSDKDFKKQVQKSSLKFNVNLGKQKLNFAFKDPIKVKAGDTIFVQVDTAIKGNKDTAYITTKPLGLPEIIVKAKPIIAVKQIKVEYVLGVKSNKKNVLEAGENARIYGNFPFKDPYKIRFVGKGGYDEYVSANQDFDGVLQFVVPKNLITGLHDYDLYVVKDKITSPRLLIAGSGIAPTPLIKVFSPNGGDTYKPGDVLDIQWKTENFGSLNVEIALADKNGTIEDQDWLHVTNIPNTGSYKWVIPKDIVPAGTSGAFRIYVGSYDKGPSAQDLSDESFNVVNSNSSVIESCRFNRDLALGSVEDTDDVNTYDIAHLQRFLQSKGLLYDLVNMGYFGATTQAALARYQSSIGISPANGYFGVLTRQKVTDECERMQKVTVEPVSSKVEVVSGTSTKASDMGKFTFTFDITPENNDIYISDTVNIFDLVGGVSFEILNGKKEPISNPDVSYAAYMSSNAFNGGGFYTVKEGDTERFTVNVNIYDVKNSDIYNVNLMNLQYKFLATTTMPTYEKVINQKSNAIFLNKSILVMNTEVAKQASASSVFTLIDLEMGMARPDVIKLQKFLNDNGYFVESMSGEPGSKGYESDYFGEKTKQALIKFQKDKGITPAQGYFGPKTRAAMGI